MPVANCLHILCTHWPLCDQVGTLWPPPPPSSRPREPPRAAESAARSRRLRSSRLPPRSGGGDGSATRQPYCESGERGEKARHTGHSAGRGEGRGGKGGDKQLGDARGGGTMPLTFPMLTFVSAAKRESSRSPAPVPLARGMLPPKRQRSQMPEPRSRHVCTIRISTVGPPTNFHLVQHLLDRGKRDSPHVSTGHCSLTRPRGASGARRVHIIFFDC